MNQTALLILILAAVALALFFVLRRKAAKSIEGVISRLPADPRDLTVTSQTPLGIKVYSANPLSNEMLDWIDAGYSRINKIVTLSPYNFTNKMDLGDFQVWVLPRTQNDSQGNPCFKRPAGQYAGTEWDIGGGFILAAGEFVADIEPNAIVVAESDRKAFTVDAVSYEFEHFYLYTNDRQRYEDTKTHIGQSHPIFPENV